MILSHKAFASAAALLLATPPALAQSETVMVDVVTAEGESAGSVAFEQLRHGVMITTKLMNLAPGWHGFHIHETGRCDPDFKAANSHYNPIDAEHGLDGSGGYHVGDLPNIHVGADGMSRAQIFVPQVTLRDKRPDRYPFTLQDADGSALMIHADRDDHMAMDSAGGREACGVIFAPKE